MLAQDHGQTWNGPVGDVDSIDLAHPGLAGGLGTCDGSSGWAKHKKSFPTAGRPLQVKSVTLSVH